MGEMEKKEGDDYDLPETSLTSTVNRLSILPLNDSQASSLNLSSVPEDQLTLRVEPQLIAATEKFESDPFGDQNEGLSEGSKTFSNSSTILSTGESQITTPSFAVKEETTSSSTTELEEMRKRVENNILVSGNTQLDEINMPGIQKRKQST
uniref:Uncharacterized protein n=1 Tax=Ditylenchus dipsaci TaxID=166011 RepID=A0A915DHT8_9BILA